MATRREEGRAAGQPEGRGRAVVAVVGHLGGVHGGGGCAEAGAGRVQPAAGRGLRVHVPPGAGRRLEAVDLGLDVGGAGGGHVEGPGLVGVDPGHPGVHGLHVLEVGGAGCAAGGRGGGRVHLPDDRGLGTGRGVAGHRGRGRGEGIQTGACKK